MDINELTRQIIQMNKRREQQSQMERGSDLSPERFKEVMGPYPYFDASILLEKIGHIEYKPGFAPNCWEDEYQLLFGLIFGKYGFKKDLSCALNRCRQKLDYVINNKPDDPDKVFLWYNHYAKLNILLGTIYAYRKDYVKASYHFMIGLKTNSISLSLPYCDFIKYILHELDDMDIKEETKYVGCGFEEDYYMGSKNGGHLIAAVARNVIPDMEGINGEQLVCKVGRSGIYGHFVRLGSTSNSEGKMIDIYETFIIDKDYNINKILFYFYGYFEGYVGEPLMLADGFKLVETSQLKDEFEYI